MRQTMLAGIVCLLAGTWAQGQITSFTISAGYSNVQISHNAGLHYTRDGGYVDGEYMWRLPTRKLPPAAGRQHLGLNL